LATLLLTPDGDPECGWCHYGDPCHDGISLECLTTESNEWKNDHTKEEITGAGVATQEQQQCANLMEDLESKTLNAGKFLGPASNSPTYIHQLLLSPVHL